jgi:hypothetical protein
MNNWRPTKPQFAINNERKLSRALCFLPQNKLCGRAVRNAIIFKFCKHKFKTPKHCEICWRREISRTVGLKQIS